MRGKFCRHITIHCAAVPAWRDGFSWRNKTSLLVQFALGERVQHPCQCLWWWCDIPAEGGGTLHSTALFKAVSICLTSLRAIAEQLGEWVQSPLTGSVSSGRALLCLLAWWQIVLKAAVKSYTSPQKSTGVPLLWYLFSRWVNCCFANKTYPVTPCWCFHWWGNALL